MKLGKRLKEARKKSGLSLRELQKIIGVRFVALNRIENGQVSDCEYETGKKIEQWLQQFEPKEKEMTSRDFCYWLQGYFEVSGGNALTTQQCETVRNHLNMVFKHEIDPSMGDKKHQEVLNHTHDPLAHLKIQPSDPNIRIRC